MMSPEIAISVIALLVVTIVSLITLFMVRDMGGDVAGPQFYRIADYAWLFARVLLVIVLFPVLFFFLPFIGVIVWFVLIFLMAEGRRKFRAAQQHGLLWILTIAAERSMPLAPAVEAFAWERRGWFSRQAKQLASLLQAGVSLPDALAHCPGLVSRYAISLIRIGQETGTLAQSLRKAAAVRDRDEPIWMNLHGKIVYLLWLPFFGFATMMFIMVKIVPQYEKIYMDFGSTLPSLTQLLVDLSNLTCDFWYVFLPFWLLAPVLIFYLPIRYFGWTDWDLPGMRSFTLRLDTAEILDTLALVSKQQRPIQQGVVALARSYPKKRIRIRLNQVLADIMLGVDWCESLLHRGLICQPEFAILRSAQRVGNLPWALAEMADSARRRLAYRVQACVQITYPIVIILMGFGVGFIVIALFIPLICLIQKLS